MAPANTTQPRHRSHKGCWTCKRKRIQCDETRPGCRRCTERGLSCEGYEIRLRWGAGIASRGRFSGADKPVEESIRPSRSKRRWNPETRCENDLEKAKTMFLLGEGQTSAEGEGDSRFLMVQVQVEECSPIEGHPLDQPVGVRATVNILNTPYPNADSGINKHFEVPVCADGLARGGHMENTMSGRSALMA